MRKKNKVVWAIALLLLFVGTFFVGYFATGGFVGRIATINPLSDYELSTSKLKNGDTSEWRLKKSGNGYKVRSRILPWDGRQNDVNLLLGGYKAASQRAKQKNPQGMTIGQETDVSINGITFHGYETQEQRVRTFVIIHHASFLLRGRGYSADGVWTFPQKQRDCAQIAQTEWQNLLAAIH